MDRPRISKIYRIALVIAGAFAYGTARPALAAPPAFPGAVGQGAQATGGRGGDVYHVTNLLDYDPDREEKISGSFRHAVRSAEGPRTIVFDVSGPIALHAAFKVMKDDITIAGQTSPGGITLWGYPFEVSQASNVIVRYLRIRTGDFHARRPDGQPSQSPVNGNNDMDPGSANAVYVGGGSERIIVDHVSSSWGVDETFSVTQARDVTVQNCIIAESLNESLHPKGAHGYGSLIRGEVTPEDQAAGVGGYTLYRNLWAHHRARNPSIGGQQRVDRGKSEADRRRADVNLVNNVVYNWGDMPTHRSGDGDVRINMVGNAYICGPAKKGKYIFREREESQTTIYEHGNWQDLDQDQQHDGATIASPEQVERAFQDLDERDQLISEGSQLNFFGDLAAHAVPAEQAYEAVLQAVGASLWRDGADQRIIESVRSRSGKLVDSQEEFRNDDDKLPGIDTLANNRRPDGFDADRDGMPDEFETANGLDPADPSDGNATTLSTEGYTNLETYLNQLADGFDGE